MIKEIQILDQLLTKYKLTEPVPEEVRAYFIKRKRSFFVRLCKSLGIYNIFLGAVLYIFFFSKKLGISLTVIQSAIVLTALSFLSAAAITYCGYNIIIPYFYIELKDVKSILVPIEPKIDVCLNPQSTFSINQSIIKPSNNINVPSLIIDSRSISKSGIGRDISSFTKDFIFHLKYFYPGSLVSVPLPGDKNSVTFKGTLIKDNGGYDFYIRLSNSTGLNFASLQYRSVSYAGIFHQAERISHDIVEACTK